MISKGYYSEEKDFIEKLWENNSVSDVTNVTGYLQHIIKLLDSGQIRVAEKIDNNWIVNSWVKKAILLYFKYTNSYVQNINQYNWFDKISPKFSNWVEQDFINNKIRAVPGCFVRNGAYIASNTVIMPSFINIGAYIGESTMIDTWTTIGSCAQIGSNCHISGGVGIGGVLEPLQNNPVIIEDNCFIGARSEIAEGVIIREGSVISMGVFLGASTKIYNRETKQITYGEVPAYSVVIPGTIHSEQYPECSLNAAIIIKQVDERTRAKVSINELLRDIKQ